MGICHRLKERRFNTLNTKVSSNIVSRRVRSRNFADLVNLN